MKTFTVPEMLGKTPFRRFEATVRAALRAPRVPAKAMASTKPTRRKPSR